MIEHVVVIPNSNDVNTSFVESQKIPNQKEITTISCFMKSVRSVYYVCLSNSEDSVTSLQDQFNLQIEVYIQFWISFFSFFFRTLYRLHLFVVCNKMDQQNQTIGFRTWHYKEYCLLLSLVWNNQTAAAATT